MMVVSAKGLEEVVDRIGDSSETEVVEEIKITLVVNTETTVTNKETILISIWHQMVSKSRNPILML